MCSSPISHRLIAAQNSLLTELATVLPVDGNLHLAPGLDIFRRSETSGMVHSESNQAFCVIAEGSKVVFLGERSFSYDKDTYILTSMQLPTVSHIIKATPDEPYLSLRLDLDPAMVSSVLLASAQTALGADDISAFSTAPMGAELLDAVVRLVRVSQQPDDERYLAPLIRQEIIYRLLNAGHGGRLSQIAGMGPTSQRISTALLRMRAEFDHPLSIGQIARDAGMSVSSFHDHFKKATGLTPLQYQKHLRLREARRLLVNGDTDVAEAGFRVGYGDASHFNREYKRMFGEPPLRDIQRLRAAGPLATSPN